MAPGRAARPGAICLWAACAAAGYRGYSRIGNTMRTALDATGSLTTVPVGSGLPGRRADAGVVRLTERDVAGPLLAGDMYGAPYDLLASFLGVAPASPKPTPAPETPPCSTPSPCWGTCCPTPRPDSSSSYEAFDLQALYNNNLHQVTIHVTITRLHPPRRRRHHQRRRRPPRPHRPPQVRHWPRPAAHGAGHGRDRAGLHVHQHVQPADAVAAAC
jgi:hypothetical protein